jgi:hypothetical protein
VVVVHMSLSSTSEDRRPCILPNLPSHTASRSSPSFLFLFKGNLKTHAEAWAGERHKTLQEESPAHRDREHSCIHRSFRSDKAMPSATQVECSYFQRLTPYYQYSVIPKNPRTGRRSGPLQRAAEQAQTSRSEDQESAYKDPSHQEEISLSSDCVGCG